MTQAQMREINQLSRKELSLDAATLWSQIEEASSLGSSGKVEQLLLELMAIQDGIETKIDAIAWVVDQSERSANRHPILRDRHWACQFYSDLPKALTP
jgi:hypothetical protein